MSRILVTYASLAGSTAEVAQVMGEEIAKREVSVEVVPLTKVTGLAAYDGVVVVGPMIMGWHREAMGFLKKNRDVLRHVPLAVVVTAMSLTETGETTVGGLQVYVDEKLPKPPQTAGHLNFRERYARLGHYIEPILAAALPAKPVMIGVFGGRVEYGRLPWWAVLFAMVIIQAPAGDRRNWPRIRAWAASIPGAFNLQPPKTTGQGEAARIPQLTSVGS